MNMEYFPETDTLSITLRDTPYQATGEDTGDPDVLLYYDEQHRLAEVEVSNASRRANLRHLRGLDAFEEVRGETHAFETKSAHEATAGA
jgi:uncharacterized protein YuzE